MSTQPKTKVLQALESIYSLCKDHFEDISIERIFKTVDAPYPFLAMRVLIQLDMIQKQAGRIEKTAIKWIGNAPNENMAKFVWLRLSEIANGKPPTGVDFSDLKPIKEIPMDKPVRIDRRPIEERRREIKMGEVVYREPEDFKHTFIKDDEDAHLAPKMDLDKTFDAIRDKLADGKPLMINSSVRDNEKDPEKGIEEVDIFSNLIKECDVEIIIYELQRRGYKGELYKDKVIF